MCKSKTFKLHYPKMAGFNIAENNILNRILKTQSKGIHGIIGRIKVFICLPEINVLTSRYSSLYGPQKKELN